MKKLNAFRFPALFALFLSLTFGAWAQKANGEASPETPKGETEAKKELYRELGVKWIYEDGASLESAKAILSQQGNAMDSPELSRKAMQEDFATNKENWYVNNPAKYNQYVTELGIEGASKANTIGVTEHITKQDYESASAEKKAFIDANASKFVIDSKNPSTK